jgi:hypothetical protein
MTAVGEGQRRAAPAAGADGLVAWAEKSGHHRPGGLEQGGLRFVFYGRVSTEDWQAATSRGGACGTRGLSAQQAEPDVISADQIALNADMFDPGKMNQDRSGANADRIVVAQLTGEARHRARWRPLTEDEEAAALAELRALAGGRADLLAQVTGIFEGTSEGEPDEPLARSAARLCRLAGADTDAIPAWIEEGRRRSANARRPPFSGG